MNNKSLMIGVVVVLVIGVIGFWLFNMQNQSIQKSTNPSTTQETSETSPDAQPSESAMESQTVGEVKEFTIESKGLNFTPSEIKVKKGDKVRITYKNTLGSHDFTLDEFNIKTKRLGAGEEETVEFTADQAGEFEYYCSVPGHRQAGMKGKLIVE